MSDNLMKRLKLHVQLRVRRVKRRGLYAHGWGGGAMFNVMVRCCCRSELPVVSPSESQQPAEQRGVESQQD